MFQADCGWTLKETDETDLDYILDILILRDKLAYGKKVEPLSYIDEVL